eukprot:3931252-Alexandrium_andersonii.AAC.1
MEHTLARPSSGRSPFACPGLAIRGNGSASLLRLGLTSLGSLAPSGSEPSLARRCLALRD